MWLQLLLSLLPTLSVARISFEKKCDDLANIFVEEDVVVYSTEWLRADSIIDQQAEGFNETCIFWSIPPIPVNLCRVGIKITTSNSSSTLMEAWLPEKWEGRYLQVGNSGLGGCWYT